jgi:hypothetical protein
MPLDCSNIVNEFINFGITSLLLLVPSPQFPEEGKVVHVQHYLFLYPLLLLFKL